MARWGPLSRKEWLQRKRLLEGGGSGNICSVEGCLREVFTIRDHNDNIVEKFDKCIFHVEKENEYWIENYQEYVSRGRERPGDKVPIRWNEELIYQFWQRIRESLIIQFDPDTDRGRWGLRTRGGCDFSYFVFPAFYYGTDIHAFWDSDGRRVFTDDIDFEGAQFLDRSYFVHVEFKGFVDFDRAYFRREAGFLDVVFHQDVEFDEAVFEGELSFQKVDFNAYLNVERAVVKGKLKFAKVNIRGYGIFSHSRLGELEFNSVVANSDLSFENVHFGGKVVLEKAGILGMFYVSKSEFSGNVYLKKVEFKNKVLVEDSVFKGDVFIGTGTSDKKSMDAVDGSVIFRDEFWIRRTSFRGVVDFSNVEFYDNVNFISSYFDKILNLYRVRLNLPLTIDFTGCFLGVSSYVVIEEIGMINPEEKKSGNSEKEIRGLRIRFPANSKRFILKNIHFGKQGENGIQFLHVCLEGNVEDVQFISVTWEDLDYKKYCGDWTGYSLDKRREIYRQHKVSLDRQENYLYARKFYEMEMKMYKERLSGGWIKKGIGKISLKKWKRIEGWIERILFEFHDVTSRFGNSILRPLVFLILITFGVAIINNHISGKVSSEIEPILLANKFLYKLNNVLYDFFLTILLLFPGGASIMNIVGDHVPWLWVVYFTLAYYFVYQFIMAVRNLPRR